MRAHILFGLAMFPIAALADAPRIVTDIPITASLVQQVAGDLAEVESLLQTDSDPHDFQLRPSQSRALQNADLLIWMGPELTLWLDRAATALDESSQMQLLHQPGTRLRDYSHAAAHEHADEHDHDHDHGSIDPHAWLDPDNGKLWMGLIADRLAGLDPDNASTYHENAMTASARLSELDAQLSAELQPAQAAPFVAFHDAYGYFTDHFGLPPAVTVTIGDASAPSAARLSEVQSEIAESGARCAFTETGHAPRMIETAVEGMGLTIGGEISPTGSTLEAGSMLYGEVLSQISARISACATSTE